MVVVYLVDGSRWYFFTFFRFWRFGISHAQTPLIPSLSTGEMVITGSVFQQFGPQGMGKGKGSGKGRGKGRANPPYSHMDWQTLASCSCSFDGENLEIQLHEEESEDFYVWSLCQKLSARTTHFFPFMAYGFYLGTPPV